MLKLRLALVVMFLGGACADDEPPVGTVAGAGGSAGQTGAAGQTVAGAGVGAGAGAGTGAGPIDAGQADASTYDGCGMPGEMLRPAQDLKDIAHCTTVRGDLNLGDYSIKDVDPLEKLRVVDGRLNLFRNEYLTNLRGLRNLERVGAGLFIHNGRTLETLEGLEKLESVGGELLISSNQDLRSIDALSGLRSVGGDVFIRTNLKLPQADVVRWVATVRVTGMVDVSDNGP